MKHDDEINHHRVTIQLTDSNPTSVGEHLCEPLPIPPCGNHVTFFVDNAFVLKNVF